MRKPIQHVRRKAKEHQEEQLHLKGLLEKAMHSEQLMGWFVGTFVITLSSLIIFFNWSAITSFFKGPEENPNQKGLIEQTLSKVHGFKAGISTAKLIEGQTANEYLKKIDRLYSNGYQFGINTAKLLAKKEEVTGEERRSAFFSSLILSYDLGNGEHLTAGRNIANSSLQKSLVTSYYLGQKTALIHSTLQKDAELLSKIKSTLSVDIFAYLNQSISRADGLENYLSLLQTLQKTATQRSAELQSQITFLSSNFEAQEKSVGVTEEDFFRSLEAFNGGKADEQLTDFIDLQQGQSEIKAKIGAYEKLKYYYDFFIPKLENLSRAIQANRDPLIAGVKVVEIENMTLPLIIKEK